MTESATIINPIGKPGRHKWGDPARFQYKTETTCSICGITKITRHEPGEYPWLEFFRDGVRIEGDRTPECSI